MEDYQVQRRVSKGNWGSALRVAHRQDGRPLLLKQIPVGGLSSQEKYESLSEVELISQLRHPCLVQYEPPFFEESSLCVLSKVYDGCDLASFVRNNAKAERAIGENQALLWTAQICLALHCCHSKGILHRDLQSRHVSISDGRVLVGEFGLSPVLSQLMAADTNVNLLIHLSPEIFKGKEYSSKSDCWSVGCVLYEMIAGHPPFQAHSLSSLARRVIARDFPGVPHSYSKPLRTLVDDLLQESPAKRPSMSQVLRRPLMRAGILEFYVWCLRESRRKGSEDDLCLGELKKQVDSLGLRFTEEEIRDMMQEGHSYSMSEGKMTEMLDRMKKERERRKSQRMVRERSLAQFLRGGIMPSSQTSKHSKSVRFDFAALRRKSENEAAKPEVMMPSAESFAGKKEASKVTLPSQSEVKRTVDEPPSEVFLLDDFHPPSKEHTRFLLGLIVGFLSAGTAMIVLNWTLFRDLLSDLQS